MRTRRISFVRSLGLTLVFLLAALACAGSARDSGDRPEEPPPLRVMTFNVRYDNPDDGADAWSHRRDHVAEIVAAQRADVVGCQEVLAGQLADLKQRLPHMGAYAVGRDDGRAGGEAVPIFYREARLTRLDAGTFWLSPPPDDPGSVGWDAALPRIASWLRLRDRATGEDFVVLNTHFDHRGTAAREESAKLLSRRVGEAFAELPVVLTGDFNATPASPPYEVLLGTGASANSDRRRLLDAFAIAERPPHGPASTWNGFDAIVPGRRIDFIFVTPGIRVRRVEILDERRDGRFPSDHLPVLAEVVLSRGGT